MVVDILIGNKRNNVIGKLRNSRIAKVMLLFSWLLLYEVMGRSGELRAELILKIAILGVLLVNLLYVPVRVLVNRRIDSDLKILFLLVMAAVLIYRGNTIPDISFDIILESIVKGIIYPLALIVLLPALYNFWKVHAKKSRRFVEGCEVDSMDGHDFEYYCADLLKKNEFQRVEVTPGSADYGIDIIAWKNGVKYGIQCKRYSGSVGWRAVEEAHAGAIYYGCDKAVVLTNSMFTKQAVNGASKIGVLLWDRQWIGGKV
uniref:restriction endonuclease n=1 Tax=Acetatifactor sp. TaxID=1872090 RepID=UPI004055F7ED